MKSTKSYLKIVRFLHYIIYDDDFCRRSTRRSAALIDAIIRAGHKFVMRCPTEFLRSMDLALADNTFEHKFTKLKYPVKVRVVKIQLSDLSCA